MTYQENVSSRIAMLRFIMICGVVLLHTPLYVAMADTGPGAFDNIKAFFQQAVFRTSVPVLTLISGYLLFNSNLDQQYKKLASKKFKTIVVPFLFFNLGLLVVVYVAETKLGMTMSYDLTKFNMEVWLNAAFGLNGSPVNYPLNFMRDLIVLMVLSPVFGIMLRKMPNVGLILVVLIFLNNLDQGLILRDVMAVMFYIGGMAAVRKWNLLTFDKYAGLCLAVFLGVCMTVIYFRIANTTLLRMISPFLIWPAAALVSDSRFEAICKRLSPYSFFIFMAHAPILLVSWMVYSKIQAWVAYPIYWIMTPVVTVAILICVHNMLRMTAPGVFGVVLGTPVSKKPKVLAPSVLPA